MAADKGRDRMVEEAHVPEGGLFGLVAEDLRPVFERVAGHNLVAFEFAQEDILPEPGTDNFGGCGEKRRLVRIKGHNRS